MEEPNLSSMTHLGTKSSVFHPTQMGAGSQQEIFRHMKRHYDRLGRVTAATDTTPPAAFVKSTLARDRKKKHPLADNFKIPVTSKLVQEHMDHESSHMDAISLPTKDSDVQSILRRMPELQATLKFKSSEEMEDHTWNEADEDVETEGVPAAAFHDNYVSKNRNSVDMNRMPVTPRTAMSFAEQNPSDLEGRYLKFVSDITRDVLASSISSDRALNMLFERHIDQNKATLNEAIMRDRVRDLKVKLNIKS